MGTYTWLRLVRGGTLVFPGMTDHVNQPLVFRSPSLLRRCVTKNTFEHASVQRYIAQGMLVVDSDMSPKISAPAAALPAVKPAPVTPRVPEPPPVVAISELAPPVAEEPAETVSSAVESAPLVEPEPVLAVEEAVAVEANISDGPAPQAADQSPEPALSPVAEAPKPSTDTPKRRRRG